MPYDSIEMWQTILFRVLEASMIIFTILHFILSIIFFVKLVKYVKTNEYQELIKNPLANSAILAPFISITMTMNVFIGPVRYFIPTFASNLQMFMMPALIAWTLIWVFLLKIVIKSCSFFYKKSEFSLTQEIKCIVQRRG